MSQKTKKTEKPSKLLPYRESGRSVFDRGPAQIERESVPVKRGVKAQGPHACKSAPEERKRGEPLPTRAVRKENFRSKDPAAYRAEVLEG